MFLYLHFFLQSGRYDIEVFPTFFRLRGKTYDYKIQMAAVMNLFLLPKLDEVHELFVVSFSLIYIYYIYYCNF